MTSALAVVFGLLAVTPHAARGAPGRTVSAHGVTVWLSQSRFQGDMTFVKEQVWQAVSLDELSRPFGGDPVIASETLLAAFDSTKGCVSVYTRKGGRLEKRGVVRLDPVRRPVVYAVVAGDAHRGVGIEVRSASATASSQNPLAYVVYINRDGIIEFKPGRATGLTIDDCQVRYGIVPSYIGVDLVFDPAKYGETDRLHIPSMNLYVGLMAGNDCVMVGVWPTGDQAVRLGLGSDGGKTTIDGFTIDMAGRSFYLSYLAWPNIWHAEALKDAYLEADTVIGWQRPFEAMWIGRFLIKSDGMHYPFYFRRGKTKMWGRYIRGWYYYPVWFAGEKTTIHFEKKFPPQGEVLIYCLEGPKGATTRAADVSSPIEVMSRALGRDMALKLLDFNGITPRPLLKHGMAVCEMTRRVGKIFAAGKEVDQKAQVALRADEIAAFIRMVRERVLEFDEFARRTKGFLDAQGRADPDLAEAFKRVTAKCDHIRRKVKRAMPRTSLEEVRGWTEQIKGLAGEVHEDNLERFLVLSRKCRQVAGAQDELARAMSVLAIRVMEEAVAAGVGSPERVKLAERIVAKVRAVLRRPTWWEPWRSYSPRRDPGNAG